MRPNSLKNKLRLYLKERKGVWVSKGDLEDFTKSIVREKGKRYLAENGDRRLRELENEGIIKVKQEGEAMSDYYQYPLPREPEFKMIEGQMVASFQQQLL